MDDNSTNSTTDDHNESKVESSEASETTDEQVVNSDNENTFQEETESAKSKEDYSACIKLIEKFQEAVLDNAVRVIQVAFKRFRERRRFLKLRRAATVIQRSVRRWLKLRHSSDRHKCHLAIKGDCEHNIKMQGNCLTSENLDKKVALDDGESDSVGEESGLAGENHDGLEEGSSFDHARLTEDKDGISETVSEKNDFENSFESLDASSLSGSTDNISDAGVCIDQCEDTCTPPIVDPDSLSLADSGIDMCTDTAVEAAITDDCKLSSSENPLLISSSVANQETTS